MQNKQHEHAKKDHTTGACTSGDMKKSSGSCGSDAKKSEQMGSCGSSSGNKGKSGSCS